MLRCFGQGRLGGKEINSLSFDGLFAETCCDKEGDPRAADKSAGCCRRIEDIDVYPIKGSLFFGVFSQLTGMHVFLQMSHGPAGLVFVSGRAFLLLVRGLLSLIDRFLGRGNPLPDKTQTKLFELVFKLYFFGIRDNGI